eukprot:129864-Rhodomonas_salina.1
MKGERGEREERREERGERREGRRQERRQERSEPSEESEESEESQQAASSGPVVPGNVQQQVTCGNSCEVTCDPPSLRNSVCSFASSLGAGAHPARTMMLHTAMKIA